MDENNMPNTPQNNQPLTPPENIPKAPAAEPQPLPQPEPQPVAEPQPLPQPGPQPVAEPQPLPQPEPQLPPQPGSQLPPQQPIVPQPTMGPSGQPAPSQPQNKKWFLIGGGIAGVVILIVVILMIFLLGGNGLVNAKRTLTCDMHISSFGVVGDQSYVIKIDDGSIKQIVIETKLNLEKSKLSIDEGSEEDAVNEKIKNDKSNCTNGCTFSSDYSKGKYLKETLTYDEKAAKENFGSDITNYSADEIADELQNQLENYISAGNGFTCKKS